MAVHPAEKSDRTAAILWLVAAALSLVAAVLTYSGEGRIKWVLLAATVFMAALGFRSLRRSGSDRA